MLNPDPPTPKSHTQTHTLTHRDCWDLELHDKLVDEGQEVVELPGLRVLEEVGEDWGDEGQDLSVQAHHHAVQVLPYARLQLVALPGRVQGHAKQAQQLREGWHAATLLHRLGAWEPFAGSTATAKSTKFTGLAARQKTSMVHSRTFCWLNCNSQEYKVHWLGSKTEELNMFIHDRCLLGSYGAWSLVYSARLLHNSHSKQFRSEPEQPQLSYIPYKEPKRLESHHYHTKLFTPIANPIQNKDKFLFSTLPTSQFKKNWFTLCIAVAVENFVPSQWGVTCYLLFLLLTAVLASHRVRLTECPSREEQTATTSLHQLSEVDSYV